MGILAGILIVIIIVVVLAYAGSQIMSFVTDTSQIVKQRIGDAETQIPTPPAGSTICDLFLTATWREKSSNEVFEVSNILFTNAEGKTVKKEVTNCHVKSPTSASLLTLLDFIGSQKTVTPLDVVIPQQSAFDAKYKMSFVLVDENDYEKKLPHYQGLEYLVPAFTYEYDYEKKLVFRDIEVGEYVLELRPEGARWFDHGENQPYKQNISVP